MCVRKEIQVTVGSSILRYLKSTRGVCLSAQEARPGRAYAACSPNSWPRAATCPPARALTAHFTQAWHATCSAQSAGRGRRPHATRRPLRLPDRAAEHNACPRPLFLVETRCRIRTPRATGAPRTFDVSFLWAPTPPRTSPCICRVPMQCSHRPAVTCMIRSDPHPLATSEAYEFADMHPCQLPIDGRLLSGWEQEKCSRAVCFSEHSPAGRMPAAGDPRATCSLPTPLHAPAVRGQ